MFWLELLGSVLAGLVVVYAVLIVVLWRYARRNPGTVRMSDALRLLPDLVRLLHRIVVDRQVNWWTRARVLFLLLYLASPIDLIPDLIPVIGYADDVLIVAWVLRSVVRSAGAETLARHWPGTEAGLHVIERLAGLQAPHTGADEARGIV